VDVKRWGEKERENRGKIFSCGPFVDSICISFSLLHVGSNLFFTYLSSHSTRACQAFNNSIISRRGNKNERELLLNTLSTPNRMITVLFYLSLFFSSFLSTLLYSSPILLCFTVTGNTSRSLVPLREKEDWKKKCFLCHSFATFPLTSHWHDVNSWNSCFICFLNFILTFLLRSRVVLFKRKSLEFAGLCCCSLLCLSLFCLWMMIFSGSCSLLRLRLLMHQLRDSLYYIGHIRITLSIHLSY
jgi:hypothetical protein